MKIDKILNNNVVISKMDSGRSRLYGKRTSFSKRLGRDFARSGPKEFVLRDSLLKPIPAADG